MVCVKIIDKIGRKSKGVIRFMNFFHLTFVDASLRYIFKITFSMKRVLILTVLLFLTLSMHLNVHETTAANSTTNASTTISVNTQPKEIEMNKDSSINNQNTSVKPIIATPLN